MENDKQVCCPDDDAFRQACQQRLLLSVSSNSANDWIPREVDSAPKCDILGQILASYRTNQTNMITNIVIPTGWIRNDRVLTLYRSFLRDHTALRDVTLTCGHDSDDDNDINRNIYYDRVFPRPQVFLDLLIAVVENPHVRHLTLDAMDIVSAAQDAGRSKAGWKTVTTTMQQAHFQGLTIQNCSLGVAYTVLKGVCHHGDESSRLQSLTLAGHDGDDWRTEEKCRDALFRHVASLVRISTTLKILEVKALSTHRCTQQGLQQVALSAARNCSAHETFVIFGTQDSKRLVLSVRFSRAGVKVVNGVMPDHLEEKWVREYRLHPRVAWVVNSSTGSFSNPELAVWIRNASTSDLMPMPIEKRLISFVPTIPNLASLYFRVYNGSIGNDVLLEAYCRFLATCCMGIATLTLDIDLYGTWQMQRGAFAARIASLWPHLPNLKHVVVKSRFYSGQHNEIVQGVLACSTLQQLSLKLRNKCLSTESIRVLCLCLPHLTRLQCLRGLRFDEGGTFWAPSTDFRETFLRALQFSPHVLHIVASGLTQQQLSFMFCQLHVHRMLHLLAAKPPLAVWSRFLSNLWPDASYVTLRRMVFDGLLDHIGSSVDHGAAGNEVVSLE